MKITERHKLKNPKGKNLDKGITLIALIITIVVLLILAGVSIATLTGDNGILTKAVRARNENTRGSIIDQAKLDIIEWQTEQLSQGNSGTVTDEIIKTQILNAKAYVKTLNETSFITTEGEYEILYSELYKKTSNNPPEGTSVLPGQIVETTVEDNYTDGVDTATVPAGFTVSGIESEQTISEGLVIYYIPEEDFENNKVDWTTQNEDGSYKIQSEYDQFVWIPVTNINNYVRNTEYENTSISTTAYTDKNYLPDAIQPEILEGKTDAEIGEINEGAEKTAVDKYDGFYISRYEAGTTDTTENGEGIRGEIISRKDATVYFSIAQEEAKAEAKDFINNTNVKTAMISGIQWDMTMKTINGKKDGKGQDYIVTQESNTTESDRHTDSPADAGQNIADKVYNIYDLESNFFEYVAERNSYISTNTFVERGSCCFGGTSSYRNGSLGSSDIYTCFRLVLYVM